MSTDDVYKPTTEFLRNMYGHLGRTDYVPDDELDDRCAAFDRWFDAVRADVFYEALDAASEFIGNPGDTPNPYDKESAETYRDEESRAAQEQFDRWLEDIRREARAEGWDRREDDLTSTLNPYRDEEP